MHSLSRLHILCIIALLCLPSFTAAAQDTRKPRIAVMTFEDKTDRSFSWGGRSGKTSGEGLADMLTTALVNSGNYRVIEREQLNEVLAEHSLSGSGLVSTESIVEAGNLLGVDLMVFGSITEFGYAEKKTGLGGTGLKSNTATIAADIRLVNTTTGEIVAAEGVRESQASRSVSGFRLGDKRVDSDTKFDDTIVGKAARKVIEQTVKLIDENRLQISVKPAAPLDATMVTQNGEVFKEGNMVYVEAGAAHSIEIGDELIVQRDKGLSIALFDTVARLKVVDNSMSNGQASKCEVIEGDINALQSGDLVQRP